MAFLDGTYSTFGKAASYTPTGGTAVAITVMLKPSGGDLGEDSGVVRDLAQVQVRQSEVAARPGYRDTFVLADGAGNSQTWTIINDGVQELEGFGAQGGEWLCFCSRAERVPIR